MDIFIRILSNILFLAAGLFGSIGAFLLYNRLPPAWFLDYGEIEAKTGDDSPGASPRMKRFPEGIWFCGILLFVFFLFYIQCGLSLVLVCNLFSVLLFSYVCVADMKTRIIPDQFVIGLLFASLMFMVNDLSYVQESGEAWYWGILMRLLGGVAGGLVLWLVKALGSALFKQEAMGMGDVKLLFACGLLTGFDGIFWVLALSFLFAFLPALNRLLHGMRSKQNRLSVRQIPFAPFIVTATTLYLLFPSEFAFISHWYGNLTF
jgi:prepilin signal peptidase PulO-like enzyme (type II secretory pathway)